MRSDVGQKNMSDEAVGGLVAVLLATLLVVGAIGAMMLVKHIWRLVTGKKEPVIQSVSVSFQLSNANHGTIEERAAIQEFAGTLEAILEDWTAGKYDGDEFGGGIASLYFYGSCADQIWLDIEEEVRSNAPLPALQATLLYGDYRARRKTIEINETKPNKSCEATGDNVPS
jgi:hypothetical protein